MVDLDLKPSITNGLKLGNNGAHIKCTPSSGDFKAGDIIYICSYNPVLITIGTASPASTSDVRENGVLCASLTTGSAKSSYAVGSFTLPPSFVDGDVIYISRVSSSVGIAAIKIVRPAPATAPTITTQPVSADYTTGDAATPLHVDATPSAGSLTFQWKSCTDVEKNGAADIFGATSDDYTPSTASAGTYYYFCTVSDDNGSTDTDVVTITVSDPSAPTKPTIAVAPAASVMKGVSLTLTASSSGSPAPTYQWYSCDDALKTNPAAIAGETSATYSPSTASVGTFYYYVIATNSQGSAESDVQAVTVTSPDLDRTGYNTYYVTKGEAIVSGKQVLCDDITMVNDDVTYNTPGDDEMIKALNANYVSSASSSTNGWGVTFTPTVDGLLSVGVIINNDKKFSITGSSVSSFDYVNKDGVYGTIASNEWTPATKFYGLVTIAVTAGESYKFSVAGSKMSFYGFTFNGIEVTPAKEYTTMVTTNALDFSGLGVEAYVATGANASAVTMAKVTTVPAGTPLVLKGTAGTTYTIPMIASASAPATNKLLAGDGKTTIGGDGIYDYVLSNGKFYHASAGTVAVGKAYLHLDSAPAAAELTLEFGEGGTTGIDDVRSETSAVSGETYNLNGQRVAQPTKGLYIVNGKKYVVK